MLFIDSKILICGMKATRTSNKLVQLKLTTDIKDKLDKIFVEDRITTSQYLKIIATRIVNHDFYLLLPSIISNTQNQLVTS